jgi:hypothetical protein
MSNETTTMLRKILWLASIVMVLLQSAVRPQGASAANVMNYGSGGNDYYMFTDPSMAFIKASGFTTLIPFAMHLNPDGTLLIGGDVACTNGVYTGPTNWGLLVATVTTPPTTVNRYEVCIGGWTDTSYDNIKALVATKGTGPGSILYKNFQALKNAVPGIDAINDDDEQTYDLNSSKSFANMLGALGYRFTMVPYTAESFWVNLKNSITNCDYVYVQCYEGGAGNDPSAWKTAMGGGVVVIGGQEGNTAIPRTFRTWYLEDGVPGGFYFADGVFNTTYWSATIIEATGALLTPPTGLAAVPGGQQVSLSWETVPGAISYNVKRSTVSGGETNIAKVSTFNTPWPGADQYFDTGLASDTPITTKCRRSIPTERALIPRRSAECRNRRAFLVLKPPPSALAIINTALLEVLGCLTTRLPMARGLSPTAAALAIPMRRRACRRHSSKSWGQFRSPWRGLSRGQITPSLFLPQNGAATASHGMSKSTIPCWEVIIQAQARRAMRTILPASRRQPRFILCHLWEPTWLVAITPSSLIT